MKNLFFVALFASLALVLSSQSMALDLEDITAAYSAGQLAVAATAAGLIGLIAGVVGVKLITRMLGSL